MKRTGIRRTFWKPKRTREPRALTQGRQKAMERSEGLCEVQADKCGRVATQVHHRKLRRHGDHSAANLLCVCSRCHHRIHDDPVWSYERGYMVSGHEEPALVPVLTRTSPMSPDSKSFSSPSEASP